MGKVDFASLMEAEPKGPARRLTPGEFVEGKVVQVGPELIFVDVGMPAEARIGRVELEDDRGQVSIKVGDRLRARVVDANPRAPELTLGKAKAGGPLDASALDQARQSGTTVEGVVQKAVKGGVNVDVGGIRAFCPASQLELGYAADLGVYEGQRLEFRVAEVKDGGRSVVLSRRALLEGRRREREQELLSTASPGTLLEGTVTQLTKHGATIDLGGVEGFLHISELASHHVERASDVLKIGESVRVRVLRVEPSEKGIRIRLSLKLEDEVAPAPPQPEQILEGSVTRVANFGIFVQTPNGEGLVPLGELGLAPGADHRRAFPPGTAVRVVLLSHDAQSGRLRFSIAKVASVEERLNYRDFGVQRGGEREPRRLGSLGDLLRDKLGPANYD
jgi:small subunit ribosomal protein S1